VRRSPADATTRGQQQQQLLRSTECCARPGFSGFKQM
jgi:hypothetical protein